MSAPVDDVRWARPEPGSTRCQLKVLQEAGANLTAVEGLAVRLYKLGYYMVATLYKLWRDPLLAVRKVQQKLSHARPASSSGNQSVRDQATRPSTATLGLQPGEIVRVRSVAQTRETLDEHRRCQGLGYIPTVMDRYCGGVYIVKKRVDRFFDERTQRLLKLRDVVILEGVYCEPEPHKEEPFAGCQRTCFLFWKEAWLERSAASVTAGTSAAQDARCSP